MLLSKLDKVLKSRYGADWSDLEIETISLDMGAVFDELTVLQMIMLRAVEHFPEKMLNDADYFLRFIEVANHNVVDAHYHDIPSSLELAFAIQELWRILGKDNVPVTPMLRKVTQQVLDLEGHGEAYHGCLSIYSGRPLIKNEKSKAADLYIRAMDKTNGEA